MSSRGPTFAGTNDSKKRHWRQAGGAEGFRRELLAMLKRLRALESKPDIILGAPISASAECPFGFHFTMVTFRINEVLLYGNAAK